MVFLDANPVSLLSVNNRANTRRMSNLFRRFFTASPSAFPSGSTSRSIQRTMPRISAHRYAEPLDWLVGIHMEELGISSDRIGSNDHHRRLMAERSIRSRGTEVGSLPAAGSTSIPVHSTRSISPSSTARKLGRSGRCQGCVTAGTHW